MKKRIVLVAALALASFWISPEIEIIPKWLSVQGTLRYKVECMKGRGYKLYNYNWSGDVTAMITHWGFVLDVQYVHDPTNLWGETFKWGEKISVVRLQYNWRNWQFGAGVLCPFTKYDQGSKLLNKWNSNERHMRLDMAPMPFLTLSYNLQWGRQKRGMQKLVNADTDVQQSSAASR